MESLWDEFCEQERATGDTSEEGLANEAEKRASAPALYECSLALWDLDRPDVLERHLASGQVSASGCSPRTNQPLLFLAIAKRRVEGCRLLLDAGADLHHLENEKGYLFWSAFGNAGPDIVAMLLGRGLVPTEEDCAVARRRASPEVAALLERAYASTWRGALAWHYPWKALSRYAPPLAGEVALARAVTAVKEATALLITAGAGMGVDAGLPELGRSEVLWASYPPYEAQGFEVCDVANAEWYTDDPAMIWGFQGQRRALAHCTEPHEGYAILRRWGERMPHGSAVITSNVDGHFQRAGVAPEQIFESRGSLDFLQCTGCTREPFAAEDLALTVDPITFRAALPLPTCSECGAMVRPNELLFSDEGWDQRRSFAQHERVKQWAEALPAGARVVLVECGAGTTVPMVRNLGENLAHGGLVTLVRINPREPDVPEGHVGLAMGALEALRAIDAGLRA